MRRFASNMVILPAFRGSSVRCGGSFAKVVMTPFLRAFSSTSVTNEIERKFIFNDAILDYCTSNATSKREVLMRDVYFDNGTYCLTTHDMWLRHRNDKLELKWPMMHVPKTGDADNNKPPETLVGLDFYQESTDISKIAAILHTVSDLTVKFPPAKCTTGMEENIQALATAGIQPFGTILTHRVRYNLSMQVPLHLAGVRGVNAANKIDMFVDIDTVKYVLPGDKNSKHTSSTSSGDSDARSTYQIGEIEFDFSSNSNVEGSSVDAAGQAYNAAIMQLVFRVIGIEPAPVRGKVLEYLVRFRPEHFEALRKSGQLASKGL